MTCIIKCICIVRWKVVSSRVSLVFFNCYGNRFFPVTLSGDSVKQCSVFSVQWYSCVYIRYLAIGVCHNTKSILLQVQTAE